MACRRQVDAIYDPGYKRTGPTIIPKALKTLESRRKKGAQLCAIKPHSEAEFVFIETMNGRSVMVGSCVSRVGETLFENRYPADNHDEDAANQSCEEQDFDKSDRQNHQRVGHSMRRQSLSKSSQDGCSFGFEVAGV
jgi:hypothetical protein